MKKRLYKASIVLPLAGVYVVLMDPITISIPDLGIFWRDQFTSFLFAAIAVGWLCCSPLRKCCCNGSFTELLFTLVPVEIFLMVVFAQWHFRIFIGLMIMLLVAEAALKIYLRKDEKRYPYTKKRHHMYRNAFRRCSVLLTLIVSMIPCLLSMSVYGFRSPLYRAEETTWNQIIPEVSNSEECADAIHQEHIELIRCFEESRWSKWNAHEKITIMQKLVDLESNRLGIPTIPITASLLDASTLGQYGRTTKELQINIEHLSESPAEECIQTICHETFHSYQYYIVEHLDWKNPVFQSAYFKELRSWKANQADYLIPWVAGFEAYESQPIEVTARAYAAEETERLLSYIS